MLAATPSTAAPDTIVLIHGLWMTPRSWEHWVRRYTERGFRVLAPSWPGLEGEVEALRRDPSPLARMSAQGIIEHYERIIRGLDRPPIIMGHSFGGAFVQLLVDRGLGAAGVGIDSASVRGVLGLPFSTLRSAWSILRNPANASRAVPFSASQFRYAFGNASTEAESARAYERYAVPGAGRVLWQGAMANLNPRTPFRVDFARSDRAPLLFVGGGSDHVVPAWINRWNVRLYGKSTAVTGYKEFPGRSHFTVGQPGWEAVADYALDWALGEHSRARAGGVAAPAGALPAARRPNAAAHW